MWLPEERGRLERRVRGAQRGIVRIHREWRGNGRMLNSLVLSRKCLNYKFIILVREGRREPKVLAETADEGLF